MSWQDHVARVIADYLVSIEPTSAAPLVTYMLTRIGWHPDELRMWGFNIPTEEA